MSVRELPGTVRRIVLVELCERGCFYSAKAVLALYLTHWLRMSEDRATTMLHAFVVAAYLAPLAGGFIADVYLGRFKTIFYFAIVYAIGMLVVSGTAIPGATGTPPHWWGAALGLALVAWGTGAIKPNVSSFGADQLRSASPELLALYFSLFYAMINMGSITGMILTPILRDDVSCFGQSECYPLAFGVPALMMILAVVIFATGAKSYTRNPPSKDNVMVMFFSTVKIAIGAKIARLCGASRAASASAGDSDSAAGLGWLTPAVAKHGAAKVADVRAALRVLLIFLPLPVFWTLFDQQSSRWTLMALRMNGHGYLKPDQMQALNALFVLMLIPLFEYGVYPGVKALTGGSISPLKRIGLGMFVCACSFGIAGLVMMRVEDTCCGKLTTSQMEELQDSGSRAEFGCRLDSCVSMWWQVPQYFVMTCGEVMFSITGLDFAYSQAPASMKSIMSAAWLLTVAVGNVIVIVMAESSLVDTQSLEFLLFAGLLVVMTVIHTGLAMRYRYVPGTLESDGRGALASHADALWLDSDSGLDSDSSGEGAMVSQSLLGAHRTRTRELERERGRDQHPFMVEAVTVSSSSGSSADSPI